MWKPRASRSDGNGRVLHSTGRSCARSGPSSQISRDVGPRTDDHLSANCHIRSGDRLADDRDAAVYDLHLASPSGTGFGRWNLGADCRPVRAAVCTGTSADWHLSGRACDSAWLADLQPTGDRTGDTRVSGAGRRGAGNRARPNLCSSAEHDAWRALRIAWDFFAPALGLDALGRPGLAGCARDACSARGDRIADSCRSAATAVPERSSRIAKSATDPGNKELPARR